MQKEEWINQIMQSSADIKAVEPNPYLFNKIQSAIEQPEETTTAVPVFKWAFAALFFISMNVACISFISFNKKQQNQEAALSSLSSEMEFNTTYNY